MDSLLQIEGDTSNQDRPPSYNELGAGGGGGGSSEPPPTHELLLPPAYSDLHGGMGPAGGAGRPVSTAFEDQELELKDAVWYQAGLPRYGGWSMGSMKHWVIHCGHCFVRWYY